MGPVSGLLWLAGVGVAVVGRLLPGAPHDPGAVLGPRRAHRRLRGRLRHAADPLAARVARRPRGGRRRAAAARGRRALADRRGALLHGAGARAADALRGLLLPGPLRLAAGGARGRHLRVAAGHSADNDHLLVCRSIGYAVAYVGCWHDPVPQAPPDRRRAPPAPDGPPRPAHRARQPPRVRRGAHATRSPPASASRCCWPTSTPSSRSTTASATRPATACCASSPPTPRPRCAPATAWPASAATSSRSSPRAPAPRPPRRLADGAARGRRRVDAGDGPLSLTVSWAVHPRTARIASR